MPRPPRSEPVDIMSLRLPESLMDKVALKAKRTYRTKTSIITEAVAEYFERLEQSNGSNK